MVAAGLGVTLMNDPFESEKKEGIIALPISPPHLVQIGLAIPLEERISPAAKSFLSILIVYTTQAIKKVFYLTQEHNAPRF